MPNPERLYTDEAIRARLEEVIRPREGPKFNPHEIRLSESGACPRMRVARAMGLPGAPRDEEDLATAAILEAGHWWESYVVARLKEMLGAGALDTQALVKHKYGVGHIDIYIVPMRRIVEVKSTSEAAERFGLPKEGHLLQLQSYLHFFRDREEGRALDGEIIYQLRGGGGLAWRSYHVPYDPDTGRGIEEELDRIAALAAAGELPPRPPEAVPDKFPCGWRSRYSVGQCAWHHLCWGAALPDGEPAPF